MLSFLLVLERFQIRRLSRNIWMFPETSVARDVCTQGETRRGVAGEWEGRSRGASSGLEGADTLDVHWGCPGVSGIGEGSCQVALVGPQSCRAVVALSCHQLGQRAWATLEGLKLTPRGDG